MTLLNSLLALAIFSGACVIFWLFQRKPTKKAHVQVEVTEQGEKKGRLALAAGVAGAKVAVGKIKPHFKGTFGVCVAVILFAAGMLVWAEPTAAKYLWVVPILIAMAFLMVKVANTVKNEFMRGVIYVAIGLPVLLFVGPKLPGSTPALPPVYTPDQMRELAHMQASCPGIKKPLTFTKDYTTIDREGLCLPTLWAPGQCIYIRDEFNGSHGPFCDKPGGASSINHVITAVRSADNPFQGYVQLRPNYERLSFRYAGAQ